MAESLSNTVSGESEQQVDGTMSVFVRYRSMIDASAPYYILPACLFAWLHAQFI